MKNNSSKVNQVYQTTDYSIFVSNFMNRDIIPSHVESLYKNMLVHGWLKGSYIIINLNNKLIDGHHRLMAAMKAKVPVNYIIEDVADDDVSSLNKLNRKWNIIDHLRHYVKLENPHYMVLDTFMKNFPQLRPTECMMLVSNGTGSAARNVFESGKFETKDMKKAYLWGRQLMSIKPYFEDYYNKAIFVRAMVRCFMKPQFNFDEFLHRLNLRPTSLKPCGTVEQYLELIENIYNYRRRNEEKVSLRF